MDNLPESVTLRVISVGRMECKLITLTQDLTGKIVAAPIDNEQVERIFEVAQHSAVVAAESLALTFFCSVLDSAAFEDLTLPFNHEIAWEISLAHDFLMPIHDEAKESLEEVQAIEQEESNIPLSKTLH